MASDEKGSLELKKLTLEIAELERPWWKRPAYILAALPTLLAVVALSVGFINGFFSAQLTKLDNQKHDLETEIKQFEATRSALMSQNEQLRGELVKKQETLKRIRDLVPKLQETATAMQHVNDDTSLGLRIEGSPCDCATMKLYLQSILQPGLKDLLSQMAAITNE